MSDAHLVELERFDTEMVLRYSDDSEFTIDYVALRFACPCANCGPRREEAARSGEFEASIRQLRNEKPSVEVVGDYGLKFEWGSGCSMGIFGFDLLREVGQGQSPDS